MDAPDQLGPQRRMDRAVPREPPHRTQRGRVDPDAPMRPAPFPPARMTPMSLALILHLKARRLEGGFQPLAHFLCKLHLFDQAPFYLAPR